MALSRISVAVPALSSAIDQIVYSLNSHITSVCLIKTGLWLNVEQMMSVDEAKSIQIFTRILSYRMLGQIGLAWIRIFMFLPHIQWGGGGKNLIPFWFCTFVKLTKKRSVYNCNVRFIWTVRDRMLFFFFQKNTFKKSCILSQIIFDPFTKHDLVLCDKNHKAWLASMPWPWRYMAQSIAPLMRYSCSVPIVEKHSIIFPPPCLMVGMVFSGS